MNARVGMVVLLGALLACKQGGGGGGKEESTTRAADQAKASASAAPAEAGVPAPTKADPLPFAVGQWTKHRLTDGKNPPSELTYSIIEEEAGALWIEAVNEAPGRPPTVIQFLVTVPDRWKPEGVEIRRVKMKVGDRIQELSGPMLSTIRKQYGHIVSKMTMPKLEGLPQETIEVEAGKFRGCYKHRVKEEFLGFKTDVVAWHHPAVPLNAMVEMKGVNDSTHMELLAYGVEGAKSRLK
jgi:hypothetical protein